VRRLTCLIIPVLVLIFSSPALMFCAQSQLLYGAMVYVVSTPDSDLGGLLASEIAKRKLPVIVSAERSNANYILAAFARNIGTPATPVFTRSQNMKPVWEAKVVLADARTHGITWAAEFRGPCPPCDASPSRAETIFAQKFAKRFQKDLFERRSISDRIDDILAP
jgi:hypothetical protein